GARWAEADENTLSDGGAARFPRAVGGPKPAGPAPPARRYGHAGPASPDEAAVPAPPGVYREPPQGYREVPPQGSHGYEPAAAGTRPHYGSPQPHFASPPPRAPSPPAPTPPPPPPTPRPH